MDQFSPSQTLSPMNAGYLSILSWDCAPGSSSVYCCQFSTHVTFIALTPNYFQACVELVKDLQFKTFDLIIPNSDIRMISDAVNLVLMAFKLGKRMEVQYLAEMNHAWTLNSRIHNAFKPFVGKEKTLNGPQFRIKVYDDLGDGYGYLDVIANGRVDRFVPHLMGEHVEMLDRDVKAVDFLHLPYMQPAFGGYSAVDVMSMDLFASVSKKWKKRVIINSFGSPDELQYARRQNLHNMLLPPLFTSSPQTV